MPPPIKRRVIEQSLASKGFKPDDRDHTFWYFYYNGLKTKVRTKISYGSGHDEYSGDLLNAVKRQLNFDKSKDLSDFLKCPMSQDEYTQILIKKGICG